MLWREVRSTFSEGRLPVPSTLIPKRWVKHMQDAEICNRPVNLWYPRSSRVRTATAGELSCERFSDVSQARRRAEELIRCGAVLGSIQIEDVETGVLVDRVMG